jgi:hypothetical protein
MAAQQFEASVTPGVLGGEGSGAGSVVLCRRSVGRVGVSMNGAVLGTIYSLCSSVEPGSADDGNFAR